MNLCDCGRPAQDGSALCGRCNARADRHDLIAAAGALIWLAILAAIAAYGVQ